MLVFYVHQVWESKPVLMFFKFHIRCCAYFSQSLSEQITSITIVLVHSTRGQWPCEKSKSRHNYRYSGDTGVISLALLRCQWDVRHRWIMLYVSAGYLFLMRINNNLSEEHAVDTVTTLKHHKSKNKFKKSCLQANSGGSNRSFDLCVKGTVSRKGWASCFDGVSYVWPTTGRFKRQLKAVSS